MYPTKSDGFTLVELLVVLVLTSLSLSLIVPSLSRGPISNAERMSGFSAALLAYTSDVRDRQQPVSIGPEETAILADLFKVPTQSIQISKPVVIAASGACIDGAFSYSEGSSLIKIDIEAPLCTLVVNNGQ